MSSPEEDRGPRKRKARTTPVDRTTYGGAPAAVFLADLLNVAIEKAEPNIGRIVRKYGRIHEGLNSTLKDLARALERDAMKADTVNYLLGVTWEDVQGQMALLGTEMRHLDQRILHLANNVLHGEYKTFARRMQRFNVARLRQRAILSRLMKNELDLDEDIIDKDTDVPLFEDGLMCKLSLYDFPGDRDDKLDELWAKAKNVSPVR